MDAGEAGARRESPRRGGRIKPWGSSSLIGRPAWNGSPMTNSISPSSTKPGNPRCPTPMATIRALFGRLRKSHLAMAASWVSNKSDGNTDQPLPRNHLPRRFEHRYFRSFTHLGVTPTRRSQRIFVPTVPVFGISALPSPLFPLSDPRKGIIKRLPLKAKTTRA